MKKIRQKVSIVILTWNSLEFLKQCLSSIRENTALKDYEIIVIDNNSCDETREYLATLYNNSNYHIILNDENRGIAPARNQGIKVAAGEYILVLDVDTIVTPNAIDILVEYMDHTPQCGLVAAKLTNLQGDLQFTCKSYPTVASKIYRRLPFKWAKQQLTEEEMRNWDHDSIKEVDCVIGACQLMRKSVIKNIGLLDENIFYGPEDVDICLRLWQAGYTVVYNPDAVIIHDEQRITKRRFFSKMTWEHIKALAYFFWKHKYLFSRKSLYESISNHVN